MGGQAQNEKGGVKDPFLPPLSLGGERNINQRINAPRRRARSPPPRVSPPTRSYECKRDAGKAKRARGVDRGSPVPPVFLLI